MCRESILCGQILGWPKSSLGFSILVKIALSQTSLDFFTVCLLLTQYASRHRDFPKLAGFLQILPTEMVIFVGCLLTSLLDVDVLRGLVWGRSLCDLER